MDKLEAGKTYTNGKLSRTIRKIKGRGKVYYTNEKGENAQCWITTFEDWVRAGQRKSKVKCPYCELDNEYRENLMHDVNDNCVCIWDDKLFIDDGEIEHNKVKINYCPMCGRKLS